MYRVGQQPGAGTYACMNCRHKVRLRRDEDKLPFCTRCGYGIRVKYRRLA